MSKGPPRIQSRLRQLRFGTRDLLWAMVLVAVALGWWRTYRRAEIAEYNVRALEGGFRPDELTYDRSGQIREMPRWAPNSRMNDF